MERCQEAGCPASAVCVWEDDWELSYSGQVRFLACARLYMRLLHKSSKTATPNKQINQHVRFQYTAYITVYDAVFLVSESMLF